MHTVDTVFAAPATADRFVCRIAGARKVPEVVGAVRDYLAAWPAEQIAHVQKVDAGWAPFDENQNPLPVSRPVDLRSICETVHGQCAALRSAGVSLAPELLELDLFLFFACTKLAELEAQPCD